MIQVDYWRKCGSCKKDIGFNMIYQQCNISSCKKWVYCSVDCWNVHNQTMNHKSAWAEENTSPKKENYVPTEESGPRRILVSANKTPGNVATTGAANEDEILIVASKLKQYIKDKYDMNTSANVMEVLSNYVRRSTDRAIARAKSEGRKTVMDRDFE